VLLKPNERRSIERFRATCLGILVEISSQLRQLVQLLGPHEQSENSVGLSNPIEERTQPTSRFVVRTIAEPGTAEARQREVDRKSANAFRRKSLVVQWCLFVATLLAFLAAAYYARIAKQQAEIMHETLIEVQRQTVAAEKSLRATQQALNVTRENFRQDQRPYVWLTNDIGPFQRVSTSIGGALGGRLAFNFHFTNYGKSPAINCSVESHIGLGRGGGERILWSKLDPKSGSILPPGKTDFNTAFSEQAITNETWEKINTIGRIEYVTVRGRFQYFALDGTMYSGEFCVERSPSLGPAYCSDHKGTK
jgi:hypothetical protein